MKIKKGDQVVVLKGKDRGKKAKVLRTFPEKGTVLVEGVNIKKVHKKPKKEGEKGQIVEVSYPVAVSKVKFLCSKCGKLSRISYEKVDGKKERICKKCKSKV